MTKQSFQSAALLLIFLLQSACAARSVRYPEISGQILSKEEGTTLLASLAARSLELKSLKTLSRSHLRIAKERMSVRHVIVAETPGRLRIETLPLNSAYALNLLVADKKVVTFLDPGESRAYRGTLDSGMLKRFMGLALNESDLMWLIAARLPPAWLDELSSASDLQVFSDQQRRSSYLKLGKFRAFYEIDGETRLLRALQLRDQYTDKLSLMIEYNNIVESGGLKLASELKITIPQEDVELTLKLSSLDLNQKLPQARFEAEVPEGYTVKLLE